MPENSKTAKRTKKVAEKLGPGASTTMKKMVIRMTACELRAAKKAKRQSDKKQVKGGRRALLRASSTSSESRWSKHSSSKASSSAAASSLDDSDEEDARLKWIALESNPLAFTKFMHQIGASKQFAVHDVFGFDSDGFAHLPAPVKALILLYPIANDEGGSLMPTVGRRRVKVADEAPFFLWQGKELGNACGAIALIHAIANCGIPVRKNSVLQKFLAQAGGLTPEERGQLLEKDEGLMEKAEEVACDEECNQTDWCNWGDEDESEDEDGNEEDDDLDPSLDTDFHFVCFVEKDSVIYELDGCRNAPLKVGKLPDAGASDTESGRTESSFAFPIECGKIIRKRFIDRAPESVQFATLAVAGKQNK
ncbi:unnamed protein product [Amoebophrya sp. A25]|nr:unnamed protein product [Amoebophrya sp. A25]|eukprot:GSA25T00011300001.1